MRHLQDVIPDIAGGRDREARLTMRGHRRHPTGEIVVVEQLPGIVERTPTDTFDRECDRRSHRPALGRNVDRHVDIIGDLRHQPRALLQHDIVHEAEILRRDEARGQPTGLIGFHLGDLIGDRLVFAAVVFGIRDFPDALDGAPDQLEFLIGRQLLGRHREGSAGRTILRDHVEAAHVSVARLGQRYFRAEPGGERRRDRLHHPRERQPQ